LVEHIGKMCNCFNYGVSGSISLLYVIKMDKLG